MADNVQWKPLEGDSIEGTITEKRSANSSYGPFDVLTLTTANGLMDVACFGVSLKYLGEQAAVGDTITIEYVGERQSRGGRTYKHYERTLNGTSL